MPGVIKAKARPRRVPGQMNNTERAYYNLLLQEVKDGTIAWMEFEPVKFRLADNTTYTPDIMLIRPNGEIEFHEVKGSWKAPHQDDSKVKIKVAADKFWWATFRSAEVIPKKAGGGWKIRTF